MMGTIDFCNPTKGLFVAQMDDGDYIAFELTDSIDIATGLRFFAELRGHGSETFTVLETGEKFSVYVEMLGASRVTARTWAQR